MPAEVVPSGSGRSFGPGINVKIEREASTSFAAFESAWPPDWSGPVPHRHNAYDEAFYVLAGTAIFTLDGVQRECGAGSLVFVPHGVTHGFATAGEGAQVLVIATPDVLGLVEELYALGLDAEPAAVQALFARYDSEVVLPDRS